MKRHAISTRLWHWTNAASLIVLFMSGLTISNAHRYLYWGQWGFAPEQAWFAVPRFPDWMTIPGYYNLALARDWHNLFAWPFALSLLFIWIAMLANRHFRRDIVPSRREWRLSSLIADIRAHLRFDFTHGEGKYNTLQKISYGSVFIVLLPLSVLTGMALSPGLGPSLAWMIELMGGRQSARSLHFISAFALCGFTLLHVALVLATGPLKQIAGMIGGGRER